MSVGWIKLDRQICDHWLWKDQPFSYGQAWVDLLLNANHKPAKILIKNKLVEAKQPQKQTLSPQKLGCFALFIDPTLDTLGSIFLLAPAVFIDFSTFRLVVQNRLLYLEFKKNQKPWRFWRLCGSKIRRTKC